MDKQMSKRAKIFFVSFYSIMAILFLACNIYIYSRGSGFAKEHNASYYEIDYHTPDFLIGSEGGELTPEFQKVSYPSFFKYYNENDENLILKNNILEEYDDMNYRVSNLYEALRFTMIFASATAVCAAIFYIKRRNRIYGHIVFSILSAAIFFEFGMLNVATIIFFIGFILSVYLTYKTRFVDYNEKLFPI